MSSNFAISESSILVASKRQISSNLDTETVILDTTSGIYYGLNSVAAIIWELIQQPQTFAEIQNAILAKYAVEPEQCQHDILALLQELAIEGLIEVKNEAVA
ncbi:PqqD family peptide modification chaperone [Nostoc sp. CHAB 5844]|nr:PqqD family peptide modification chaperone [Nostoc sp. CHAB 5844]